VLVLRAVVLNANAQSTRVTDWEGTEAQAEISPDGRCRSAHHGTPSSAPGVRADGTSVEFPELRVRQGGYRFVPNGTGLVYLPRIQSLDFWLLHSTTKTTRQVRQFSNQGHLATSDITPDGEHIVFDRSRENSDIVLIDLPK